MMSNDAARDRTGRREFLLAAAGTLAATGLATASSAQFAPRAKGGKDFVLVHGAWHGGWCWKPVSAILEGAGHRVFTPSLKGLAERANELSADISLEDHIEDVLKTILLNDLQDVVLCGHSYGGMVITAVADRAKTRIHHMVYLDAALPENGQSMMTYGAERPHEAIDAAIAAISALAPDGVGMAPFPPELLGVPTNHPLYDWVARNLTPHPLKTWLDRVALRNGGASGLARTYVHCTAPVLAQTQFPWVAAQAQKDPTWNYAELATGHDAMVTDPDGVAQILLGAAQQTSTTAS